MMIIDLIIESNKNPQVHTDKQINNEGEGKDWFMTEYQPLIIEGMIELENHE